MDDKLKFCEHISFFCFNATVKLNALNQLQKYISKLEKKNSIRKIEQIQKRYFRIIYNDY